MLLGSAPGADASKCMIRAAWDDAPIVRPPYENAPPLLQAEMRDLAQQLEWVNEPARQEMQSMSATSEKSGYRLLYGCKSLSSKPRISEFSSTKSV